MSLISPSAPRARLHVVAAALLFSTGGAAIKGTALTAWQVASFRSGIAAAAVWLLAARARRGWSRRTVLVALAYAATLILFVTANKLTTAANTIFLQSTAPFYVLLLGPWLLREPIRRRDVLFLLVVALGLAAFFVDIDPPATTAPDPLRGNLLAMASGVAWALTVMGLRWAARGGDGGGSGSSGSGSGGGGGSEAAPDPALAAVLAGNLAAFLIGLPWALPVAAVGVSDWAVVAYLGLFQIGLAYLCLGAAVRHVPAFEVSVLLLVEPALNPVWAWAVHGEVPGAGPLLGGALILAATTVKTWCEARSPVVGTPRRKAESEGVV